MPEQVIIGEVVVHHESESGEDGRRVVAYERAGSDEGGTTDLGRKTRRWRIRGFVISAAERDKLSALLDEARRVRFRHSSGEIFQVRIESLRKSRDSLGDVYPVEIGLVLAERFRVAALSPAAEVREKAVLAWSAVGGNAEDGGTEAAPLFHRRAREMREAAADPRIFAARAVAARREDLTREAADAAERAGGLAGALEACAGVVVCCERFERGLRADCGGMVGAVLRDFAVGGAFPMGGRAGVVARGRGGGGGRTLRFCGETADGRHFGRRAGGFAGGVGPGGIGGRGAGGRGCADNAGAVVVAADRGGRFGFGGAE